MFFQLQENIVRMKDPTKTFFPFFQRWHLLVLEKFKWYHIWHTKRISSFLHIAILLLSIISGIYYVHSRTPISKADSYTVESSGGIESVSFRIRPVVSEVTKSQVQYRKSGDSTWLDGMAAPLVYANSRMESGCLEADCIDAVDSAIGTIINRVHGSIFNLDANTNYEIKVSLLRANDTVYDTVNTTAQTKPNTVSYGTGNTITVGPPGSLTAQYTTFVSALAATVPGRGDILSFEPGNYDVNTFGFIRVSHSYSGTSSQPLTIRGNGAKIISNVSTAYPIIEIGSDFASYTTHDVIVEGFVVGDVLPYQHSYVHLEGSRLVLQNNQFLHDDSGWDAVKAAHPYNPSDPQTKFEITASVFYFQSSDSIIQNNTLVADSICWRNYAVSCSNNGGHIMLIPGTFNNTFRNNNFKADRTGDTLYVNENQDLEFYNNSLEGGPWDDGMETERGININNRFWGNTFNFHGGTSATISNIPVLVGPEYFFRNIFLASTEGVKDANDTINNYCVIGRCINFADFAPIYYINNTWDFYGSHWVDSSRFFRTGFANHLKIILLNNVVFGRKLATAYTTCALQTDRSLHCWGQLTSDYNIWYPSAGGYANDLVSGGFDTHSVFADPKLTTPSGSGGPSDDNISYGDLNLHLQADSPAIDAGMRLNNINDDYSGAAPDIGAFEYDSGFTNHAPTLSAIGSKSVSENSLLEFQVVGSDLDTGDTLTYSATNLPNGASFNASTRTFSWIPSYSQSGIYSGIHFEVTDGSLTDIEDITITVNDVDTTPLPTPTSYKAADINQDNHVDLLDLSLIATNWYKRSPSTARADINLDGIVDLLDLSLVASNWQG